MCGGGAYSFVVYLSHLAVEHTSLSRRREEEVRLGVISRGGGCGCGAGDKDTVPCGAGRGAGGEEAGVPSSIVPGSEKTVHHEWRRVWVLGLLKCCRPGMKRSFWLEGFFVRGITRRVVSKLRGQVWRLRICLFLSAMASVVRNRCRGQRGKEMIFNARYTRYLSADGGNGRRLGGT